MSNGKRAKGSFDIEDNEGPSSSNKKRVRFNTKTPVQSTDDFEIDHEEILEPTKQRRGGVNADAYVSDDEEVDGGAYGSESEGESEEEKPAEPQGDDYDMFADEAPAVDASTKKKKKKLELNEIEGQEFGSHDVEDLDDKVPDGKKEPAVMAFNMQQEMEEGSFDAQGNYVPNKGDPQAFHDRWMEGISRKDMVAAREAQTKREANEALLEAARQAAMPQTQNEVYLELVNQLKPGQSVREALSTLASASSAKVPAWKQKLLDKKNKNKPKANPKQALSEEEEAERKKKVERITELADQMMALGHFGIYEDTFETMIRHLRREGVVGEDWLPKQ
ncbi:hypothetical protein J3Q64DRAFT_1771303 [Phycomyces blakesleeanus]|uniref:GYF domain-containing protein n=1 Tax=Phycomyces blakesleeanus TaxID=4837 RepID=A0ABR3AK15_PHYBL